MPQEPQEAGDDAADGPMPGASRVSTGDGSQPPAMTDGQGVKQERCALEEANALKDFAELRPQADTNANANGDSSIISRDPYGFKKATLFVSGEAYDQWWTGYKDYLQHRRKKWITLLEHAGLMASGNPIRFPPRSIKVKRYIRKGIPAEFRGAAWFFYAGGPARLQKNQGVYEQLWKQAQGMTTADTDHIERDLNRTFPDNIHFKSESDPSREMPKLAALRRVLLAFSFYAPNIGYCQSLNFIAGMLLLFMEEEKAFWMLYIVTHQYLPGMHHRDLEGVNIDQAVLMMCLKESLGKVWNIVGKSNDDKSASNRLPPVTLVTTSWFMSGFINALPIESVLRVWDCLFYEGSKILFRIALTIFKLGESQIEAINDSVEVLQLVQSLPKKHINSRALLEACFKRNNGFGHLSQDVVDSRRQQVQEQRRKSVSGSSQAPSDRGTSFKHLHLPRRQHLARNSFCATP